MRSGRPQANSRSPALSIGSSAKYTMTAPWAGFPLPSDHTPSTRHSAFQERARCWGASVNVSVIRKVSSAKYPIQRGCCRISVSTGAVIPTQKIIPVTPIPAHAAKRIVPVKAVAAAMPSRQDITKQLTREQPGTGSRQRYPPPVAAAGEGKAQPSNDGLSWVTNNAFVQCKSLRRSKKTRFLRFSEIHV